MLVCESDTAADDIADQHLGVAEEIRRLDHGRLRALRGG